MNTIKSFITCYDSSKKLENFIFFCYNIYRK